MEKHKIVGVTKLDSGWSVGYEVDNHPDGPSFVNFTISNHGAPFLNGFIKSDGCSNWWADDGGAGFHLCGLDRLANMAESLGVCYDIAKQHMPEAYGY